MRVIALEEHFVSKRMLEAIGAGRTPARELQAEPELLDLGENRIANMDAAGIDVQVLSLATPGAQHLLGADAAPVVREENDRLAEAIGRYPDRLQAFAALPTVEPKAAAAELERTVRRLGFRGAMINGLTGGRFLDDPSFRPILECAEALGVPIYLHPALPPEAVIDSYYRGLAPPVGGALATAAWGWHMETGLHTLRLIVAGTFDRFPGLQLVIGHLGEALPFMLARAGAVLPSTVTGLERPVPEYLQENVHLTTSGFFSVPPFLNALFEVGADRLLFSVDYPFSSNEHARAFLDAIPVSPSDREKIAHGNAERLLRL